MGDNVLTYEEKGESTIDEILGDSPKAKRSRRSVLRGQTLSYFFDAIEGVLASGYLSSPSTGRHVERGLTHITCEQLDMQIIRALENENYDWRTIEGIATECNIPPALVENRLRSMSSQIVCSSIADSRGRDLYTTRKHFLQRRKFWNRFLGVLSDQIR